MASKRRIKRQCKAKQPLTHYQAEATAARLQARTGQPVRAYPCPSGLAHFHIGHTRLAKFRQEYD